MRQIAERPCRALIHMIFPEMPTTPLTLGAYFGLEWLEVGKTFGSIKVNIERQYLCKIQVISE